MSIKLDIHHALEGIDRGVLQHISHCIHFYVFPLIFIYI